MTMPAITKHLNVLERAKLVDMGMIEGFTETWDRLEELLEKLVH